MEVSKRKAMEILGVSSKALQRMIDRGEIKARRTGSSPVAGWAIELPDDLCLEKEVKAEIEEKISKETGEKNIEIKETKEGAEEEVEEKKEIRKSEVREENKINEEQEKSTYRRSDTEYINADRGKSDPQPTRKKGWWF